MAYEDVELNIKSDFDDYYDCVENKPDAYKKIIYNRYTQKQEGLYKLLAQENKGNNKVALFGIVSNLIDIENKDLVYVYPNDKERKCKLLEYEKAMYSYPNSLAIKRIDSDYKLKMIVVGETQLAIKFTENIEKDNGNYKIKQKILDLKVNKIDDKNIEYPILSKTIAVDKNGYNYIERIDTVEKLSNYKFEKVLSKEAVREIIIRKLYSK